MFVLICKVSHVFRACVVLVDIIINYNVECIYLLGQMFTPYICQIDKFLPSEFYWLVYYKILKGSVYDALSLWCQESKFSGRFGLLCFQYLLSFSDYWLGMIY